MINLVAEYCKNCLQNLYRLLENLDLQCFFLKQCDGVVYISSDTSQCVWSFPSVGHFLRKPPQIFTSNLIHIVLLKRKLHFYVYSENSQEENVIMKPKLAWLPLNGVICLFIYN